MTEKLLVGLAETLDKMIASYESDVTMSEERVRKYPHNQDAIQGLRYSHACLATAKMCRTQAMTEVDGDSLEEMAVAWEYEQAKLARWRFIDRLLGHMEGK